MKRMTLVFEDERTGRRPDGTERNDRTGRTDGLDFFFYRADKLIIPPPLIREIIIMGDIGPPWAPYRVPIGALEDPSRIPIGPLYMARRTLFFAPMSPFATPSWNLNLDFGSFPSFWDIYESILRTFSRETRFSVYFHWRIEIFGFGVGTAPPTLFE